MGFTWWVKLHLSLSSSLELFRPPCSKVCCSKTKGSQWVCEGFEEINLHLQKKPVARTRRIASAWLYAALQSIEQESLPCFSAAGIGSKSFVRMISWRVCMWRAWGFRCVPRPGIILGANSAGIHHIIICYRRIKHKACGIDLTLPRHLRVLRWPVLTVRYAKPIRLVADCAIDLPKIIWVRMYFATHASWLRECEERLAAKPHIIIAFSYCVGYVQV